jgi:hypothetical protein
VTESVHTPKVVEAAGLGPLLWPYLAGTPADGSAAPPKPPRSVVWVDRGDELVVHGDSIRVAIGGGTVVMSIDVETDETGRKTLVVPMAVGTSADHPPVIVMESQPRGDATLARRWGPALLSALFFALEAILADHAGAHAAMPKAIRAEGTTLQFLQTVRS